MPHWRVVGQDGKTALQDLSGRLGRLETSDRDALEASVANERLRSRITGARLTIAEVATQVGVDPKTVERWIVLGRIPHRSHRWATASLLGTDEAYLWPELADERRTQAASTSELVTDTSAGSPGLQAGEERGTACQGQLIGCACRR